MLPLIAPLAIPKDFQRHETSEYSAQWLSLLNQSSYFTQEYWGFCYWGISKLNLIPVCIVPCFYRYSRPELWFSNRFCMIQMAVGLFSPSTTLYQGAHWDSPVWSSNKEQQKTWPLGSVNVLVFKGCKVKQCLLNTSSPGSSIFYGKSSLLAQEWNIPHKLLSQILFLKSHEWKQNAHFWLN